MSAGTSLKEQNAWLVRAALLVHAGAFAYVAFEPVLLAQLSRPDALDKLQGALAPATISLAVIALAQLVLLGMVPAWLRDRLIHWRWRYPLPGSRAFSKIGPRDSRIDMAKLERTYGPLPSDPAEQDRLFYAIYKSESESVGVLDAHKSYLAARDIGMINLILFILLPPFAWWATGDLFRTGTYAAALFMSYLVMAAAAKVYGTRLVENALAAASSK